MGPTSAQKATLNIRTHFYCHLVATGQQYDQCYVHRQHHRELHGDGDDGITAVTVTAVIPR